MTGSSKYKRLWHPGFDGPDGAHVQVEQKRSWCVYSVVGVPEKWISPRAHVDM